MNHTTRSESGGRVTIQTTDRRASAILMVLAGGTLQQVGDELGVSRQRISQYMDDAGLSTSVRQPFGRGETGIRRFQAAGRKRARLYAIRQGRIRAMVNLLWSFAYSHDRPPTHRELAELTFSRHISKTGATAQLAVYLGISRAANHVRIGRRGGRYGKQARRVRALYRLAGFPEERRGCWTGRSWENRG